eukprot:467634_1
MQFSNLNSEWRLLSYSNKFSFSLFCVGLDLKLNMSSQRPLRPRSLSQTDALLDFNVYFPTSDQQQPRHRQTASRFYKYLLQENYDKYIKPQMNEIREHHRILFNFQTLKQDADALNTHPDPSKHICSGPFYKFFIQRPALLISLLSCAAAHCYFTFSQNTHTHNTGKEEMQPEQATHFTTQKYPKHSRFKITARIINFDKINCLKDLKSHSIEKYVVIRGTVIRIGTIKPLVLSIDYQCVRCGGSSTYEFPDGKINPVTGCPSATNTRCKSKNSRPLHDTAKCIDHQKIRVQELSTDETGGRVPRTIDIELTEDLVDQCVPGDVVTVGGIVRATKCESTTKDNKRTLYQLYIKANSIVGIGSNSTADEEDENSKLGVVEFTRKDYMFINKLVNEPHVFRLLVNSVCPSIFGHEIVKAGLLLSMVGGNTKLIGNSGLATNKTAHSPNKDNDGDSKMADINESGLHIRGDIHMLIVGDPGLGKSQMLRAVARIAPRGVYVSGNTTSIAGLTVTMVRDGGDHALEAGALVMGDQGVCCIDEFDKMGNQHSALLEAMEQQSISIAKSGMVCTLSARTSVIAAANPCGGHYDASKTISENIKMSAPLLSRFDLLFLLLDKPDTKHDQRLSDHVMRMLRKHAFDPNGNNSIKRNNNNNNNNNNAKCPPSPRRIRDVNQIGGHSQSELKRRSKNQRAQSLQSRLELSHVEYKTKSYEPIPESLLRKYIVYVRKYCHPKMTSSAKKVLLNFYLELRKQHQQIDSTPITTRQLESLIRLAEARAKVELRLVITEDDACDVVEIMRASLYDVMENEKGKVDFKRSKGASMPKLQKEFKKVLQIASRDQRKNRFTVAELRDIMTYNNFPADKHDKLILLSNRNGTLLQKNSGAEYEFCAV